MKQLIQQILTENEDDLKIWRMRLEKGLKGNGKLMVDLIPDLELIIGTDSPPLPSPPPKNYFPNPILFLPPLPLPKKLLFPTFLLSLRQKIGDQVPPIISSLSLPI